MAQIEKARQLGEPIPSVCQDAAEFSPSLSDLQEVLRVSRLTRRCAISATTAATLAPIIFGQGSRGS